jgi:lipopolysaccharide export LptBFGC system permease protein LptF
MRLKTRLFLEYKADKQPDIRIIDEFNSIQGRLEIFDIYESNKNGKESCVNQITWQKVTKLDQDWLLNLEKGIYSSISQNDMNLYELFYYFS